MKNPLLNRFRPHVRLLWVFLPLLLAGADPATGQEEIYLRGNRLYQEDDFSGALEAYTAVLEGGYESGDLHFNLGNAYFKTGDLGRSILSFERALRLDPRDPDIRANLELARSLTADEIEPLPRFWVLSVASWWVNLLPHRVLIYILVFSYLLGAGGLCVRILSERPKVGHLAGWLALGAGLGLLIFGTSLLAQDRVLGGAEWGVILAEEVPVQSAPSDEGDLTLFHVHEGTKVRLDQATEEWSEIVLEDGKVGWVPSQVFEII